MMNRAGLAALVVGAGLAGAAAYWFFGLRATTPAVPAAPAAAASPDQPARRLADTVPAFQLLDREGQLRSLQDWQGKSLVVNFWATWCAPCRREIPLLQQIARERADDGVEVVGIAVDFRDKVLAYADEMQIGYPLLIGEQDALDAAAAFGVDAIGFPFTIFTDNRGRVVFAQIGELHRAEAELILDEVAAVNAGEQSPAEAREMIENGLPALQHKSAGKSAG
ncbi:MAG TPA: TlpA disulfide reductase family protein [Steroidobacteraceae bacterium]|jgi:thiol-disulfide isomerase/thioredoxin|nr:TlpA disulfide reductase family protein [Steroidobacteraceae bacterium]